MGQPRLHYEGEMCEECGLEPKMSKGKTPGGYPRWGPLCTGCNKARWGMPWLKFRGHSCEYCDRKPMFRRSLDVHHRDGDKTNNDPDNLTTICATCHRELEGFLHQFDGDVDKAESMLERLIRTLT